MRGWNITRRDVLWAIGGSTLGALQRASAAQFSSAIDSSTLAIPGPYRGKVIGISHQGSIVNGAYQATVIAQMFQRGMQELSGARNWKAAWKQFFQAGDVVGIKVNPAGLPYIVSDPTVLLEIIRGLEAAGVQRSDIVVYDRYSGEFHSAGMGTWIPDGVQTMFASQSWDPIQQSIDGYDPDHYMEIPYGIPGQDTSNPAVRRSYAALFITQKVNKLVNLSVLKDHQAAGVTLSLKNLSHGLVNNVNRSHPDFAQNFTADFIPASVSIPVIRSKAVLHIVDGIRGLYHSGPHAQPQFLWDNYTLYFATDPVALDRIGWTVIDEKREAVGMLPVALAPPDQYSGFLNRHPEHIVIAGMLGLGEWDSAKIDYRNIRLDLRKGPKPWNS